MDLHFEVFWVVWPALLRGALNSLVLIVAVMVLSTIIGLIIAFGLNSRIGWFRQIVSGCSWVARGIPPLMLLFVVFLALPQIGIVLSPYVAATTGMTMYISFYFAEAFSAGMRGIPKEQRQAAAALALPRGRTFRRVIFPQMLPAVLPSYFSRATEVVKGTAIAAVVAYPELALAAKQSLTVTFRPIEVLCMVGVVYLVANGLLIWLQVIFERRSERRGGRA